MGWLVWDGWYGMAGTGTGRTNAFGRARFNHLNPCGRNGSILRSLARAPRGVVYNARSPPCGARGQKSKKIGKKKRQTGPLSELSPEAGRLTSRRGETGLEETLLFVRFCFSRREWFAALLRFTLAGKSHFAAMTCDNFKG